MKHVTPRARIAIPLALSLVLLLSAVPGRTQPVPDPPLNPGHNDTTTHNLSDSLSHSVTVMQPTDTCNGWIFIDVWGGNRFGTFPPYHVYRLPDPYFINPIPPSFLNDSLYVIGPVCPGTYYFTIIDSSGTIRRDSTVLVRKPVSSNPDAHPRSLIINSVTQQATDQFYPNPFTDYTSVRFNSSSDGNITVIVYDKTGKAEQRTGIAGRKGAHVYVLDGRELSKGIHFVNIIMPDRSFVVKVLRL